MNQTDILRALNDCESAIKKQLAVAYAVPVRADTAARWLPGANKRQHALWMIVQAREFVREGRLPKAFRWLGFVQGVMWVLDIVTIEQAKEANRPKDPIEL